MKCKTILILIIIICNNNFAFDQALGITYSQFSNAAISDNEINNMPNINAYYQINLFKFIAFKNEISYGWKEITPYTSDLKYRKSMQICSANLFAGLIWFNQTKNIGFSLSPSIGITRAESITEYKNYNDTLNFNTIFWGLGLNQKVELLSHIQLTPKVKLLIGTEYLYHNIELDNLTIKDKSKNLWGITFVPRSYSYHNESMSFKIGLAYSL